MIKDEIAAIVLAAGEGKRMKPLGANVYKVMLPVCGKPVLAHVMDNVLEAGIKKVFLVVSQGKDREIKKYFRRKWHGVDIEYVYQDKPLGPADAISRVLAKIKSEYFLVQYGDSLADCNIAKQLIAALAFNNGIDGVAATHKVSEPSRHGVVHWRNGQVAEIIEKPLAEKAPSSDAVMGTFILKTEVYRKAVKDKKFIYGKELFPVQYILDLGCKILNWHFGGRSVDVGKPKDLFSAGQLLAKSSIKCIAFDADNTLYNTHKISKFADIEAFKILSAKTGIAKDKIYGDWQKIVADLCDSKVPEKRTRLYSYNLLLSKLGQDKNMLDKMYQDFTKSLVGRIRPLGNIKEILGNLGQTKIVFTEDVKSLTILKLKSCGLYTFFEGIATSDAVGVMKPSKKYYESLLSKYRPEEILVVGDDWQKDLEIPAALGMQVLFIEREEDFNQLLKLGVQPLKIHIMGMAGAGATAVAAIAQSYGFRVSGCDLVGESAYTWGLPLKVQKGHNPVHLKDIDLLVVSPAVVRYDHKNEEVLAAKNANIPIMTWQEFQGRFLQKDKFVIAVCGAYGKSTTTAMISQILVDAGFDPICEIGAVVFAWGKNFRVGKSSYYVCEADEYNNNFLNYEPDVALVLNIGWDHPDFFKKRADVIDSYKKFILKIKKNGVLLTKEEPELIKFAQNIRPDIKIVKIESFGDTKLSIIGGFRRENADAALTLAKIFGLDLEKSKLSLKNFSGVKRRLEFKGEINGVKVYDDYAVQPYTVLATANALFKKFSDKRIVLVFEPHTFSRIETFFDEFVLNLKNTKIDRVLITNIYAAREKGDEQNLSLKLTEAIGSKAKYTGTLSQTAVYLRQNLADYDIILSMGAGNIYKIYDLLGGK